eukprot:COSAG01_NODE_66469_length_270_cov_0.596491_1_plen_89_part_11
MLTVATPGASVGPLLGTSAFFAEDPGDGQPRGMSRAKLWEPYTWDLGAPVTTHANVTAFDVSAEGEPSVYVRYFEKAVVLVNPGNLSAR